MQRSGVIWRATNTERRWGRAGSLAHAWIIDEHKPGVGSALWTARQWYGPVVSCIGTVCCRFVHWMCGTSLALPGLLHRQRPTLLWVPHPAQPWHILPASGSAETCLLPVWDPLGKAGHQKRQFPNLGKKLIEQGLAGNLSQLCAVLLSFSSSPEDPWLRRYSKVKRQNTELRTDRMGYLCSCLCLNGICHCADDWTTKIVCKTFFWPSLVPCISAQPVMLAEVAGGHPTQKYCVALFCAKPRMCIGEILTFCHSGIYLSDIVLHNCKQNYKTGFFLLFFFLKQVWRKKYKKIRMLADQLSHLLRDQR